IPGGTLVRRHVPPEVRQLCGAAPSRVSVTVASAGAPAALRTCTVTVVCAKATAATARSATEARTASSRARRSVMSEGPERVVGWDAPPCTRFTAREPRTLLHLLAHIKIERFLVSRAGC